MFFFLYLFYNQYAEIKGRGGDTRKAQLNMLILSAALITMYIILAFVVYGYFYPWFLERNLSVAGMSGRTIGRFLAGAMGLIVFFSLRSMIGNKSWFDQAVTQYEKMPTEEQKRVAKKGIQYFVLASLPVAGFIIMALLSVF